MFCRDLGPPGEELGLRIILGVLFDQLDPQVSWHLSWLLADTLVEFMQKVCNADALRRDLFDDVGTCDRLHRRSGRGRVGTTSTRTCRSALGMSANAELVLLLFLLDATCAVRHISPRSFAVTSGTCKMRWVADHQGGRAAAAGK